MVANNSSPISIITFDIEEWSIEKDFKGDRKEKYIEYDSTLDRLLQLLEHNNVRATFFCLGKMAIDFPEVIKKIHSYGHEIGCHSFAHNWLNKSSDEFVANDTIMAIHALEDLIGEKVVSYRAPAFSIGIENKRHLEILASNGIENDASIFPGERDFGGFPEFGSNGPSLLKIGNFHLHELPIRLTNVCGKHIAFSGGGYFRFFPKMLIHKWLMNSNYNMLYFHIADFIEPTQTKLLSQEEYEIYFKERGTLRRRLIRFLKSNIGHTGMLQKFESIIASLNMTSVSDSIAHIDWENKVIEI